MKFTHRLILIAALAAAALAANAGFGGVGGESELGDTTRAKQPFYVQPDLSMSEHLQ